MAALRARLAGNYYEEHKRLFQQLDAAGGMHDYMSLVSAAFLEAVDRKFANASLSAAVIEWVVDVRSRSPEASEAMTWPELNVSFSRCLVGAISAT